MYIVLQLNLYRRKHTLHPTSSAAAPTPPSHGKGSPGYNSVPTVEENLESGTHVKVRATDGAQRVIGGGNKDSAVHMESQTHQAPSSPHVHFASLPATTAAGVPDVINPLSGLRNSLSSDSSLTGYEAVADINYVKLPLAKPISPANMHVIAFAGMRGAVSFSLAYIFPNSHGNRYVARNPCHILKLPLFSIHFIFLLLICDFQEFGAVFSHCDRIVYEFFQWYADGAADSLA